MEPHAGTPVLEQIFPGPLESPTPLQGPSDEQLLALYTAGRTRSPWVSFNFVTSLDGAASLNGLSGQLGNATDQRIFHLMRRHADVLLVGAQTVRAEGYGGKLLNEAARQWRLDRGMGAHPPLAIVSGTLDLDPRHEAFTKAPVRPLILTLASAPHSRREKLAQVADVVLVGEAELDVGLLLAELGKRGLHQVHSEGGPKLLGTFQAADAVDELALTLSPSLVGGPAGRISHTPAQVHHRLELAHILREDSMLFLRYVGAGRSE